jgi:hypothetical protein
MNSETFPRLNSVSTLVRIIISQASRWRAEGTISEEIFQQQMRRVAREELEPKGLTLLVRDLPGGRTRFLFKKHPTGAVCEMMDFAADGTLETDASERLVMTSPEGPSS